MSTTAKPTWHRATKRSPCVVCGRAGSCVYTGDPKTPDAVLCVNKRSEAICGRGFLHRLDGWLCHCHRKGGADG